MRKIGLILIIMISATTNGCKDKDTNPLLEKFQTLHQSPPFSKIKHKHYIPAFNAAMEEGKREIEAIINNPEEPTFINTIEALSLSGSRFTLLNNIFFNLNEAETDSEMQEIAREISPLISDYRSDILFNEKLFEKIKYVFENTDRDVLTAEQSMLLEKTYNSFARNGAALSEEKKARLREISKELSDISLKFNDNVLAETNSWYLHITDKNELNGLPESALEASSMAAKSRNLEGWVFTLQAPSFWPIIQYADNREIREKVFKAHNRRAYNQNEFNNSELILRTVNLRLERANLLGYKSHADFVLIERMAETPEKVYNFLNDLAIAAKPTAINDLNELEKFAQELGHRGKLQYWDWYYYAEKLKTKLYEFNQEEVRPYLQLEKVKDGIFELCDKLWGLSFKANEKIDRYHEEVLVYEVYDENKKLLSLLYLDFFPRPGKSSGAWMTSFRKQHRLNGENVIPHISIVCNFTRPTETKPSLLTFNEYRTFLHEFGHALHGIFSDVTYNDLSGTAVYRDFVELPSQIMENWAIEKDFLDMFAFHYETGEKIPDNLVQKIIDSQNFHAAFMVLRQLSFALNDMAWHSTTSPINVNPEMFEKESMNPAMILPTVDNTLMSASFLHIFAGGYAAGYYGYKWAEVLDADAFETFKETGIFNKETANKFREHILSKGGTEHPMILYKRFRGQEPEIYAYLKREGLIK